MQYLVTAEEMREYDANTIGKIGIPGMVLMERAALAALELIHSRFIAAGYLTAAGNESGAAGHRETALQDRADGEGKTALILAGMGNNGGDGLALARLLSEEGWETQIWCVGSQDKASAQWKEQNAILQNYPVTYCSTPQNREYTIMIDALFGVGLSREVTGEYRAAIETFQELKGFKLALDVPSGIDSDSGRVLGAAVRADATVTFGFRKRGTAFFPGCEYAGEVTVADIGITERSFFGRRPGMFTYDGAPGAYLPKRQRDGNKGTFGKVLLIAGSLNMAGAAVLCARAALSAGAGMVKVITPEENRIILQTAVPEALLDTGKNLEESLEWADAIVTGPGLGKDERAESCLEQAVSHGRKPLVIDADGLNLLSENIGLRRRLAAQGEAGRIILLTPHVGELSRLTGQTVGQLKGALPQYGLKLAEELHAVVAAKDARTVVCGEGKPFYLNLCGNSGMATAGSGDVLAGAAGTLLAQSMDGFEAAAAAVYLHGKAGDLAAALKGERGCRAGDIAEAISAAGLRKGWENT